MNTQFRPVFYAVLTITLISLFAWIWIVMYGNSPLTSAQQTVADGMEHAFQVGIGTIFGLLGGRNLSDTPKN